MLTHDDSAFARDAWRFAAQMYLSTLVATVLWKLARGDDIDAWTYAWLVGCVIGGSMPQLLPWDRHLQLAVRLNILGGTVVQAVFVAFWYRHPAMMLIPCFGALFVATTQRWPWIFYQMAPGLVVLAVVASDRNGLRIGLADTAMYACLWASIGLISAWMRRHIDRAADKRTERAENAAIALEQRATLADLLQSDIAEVAGASAGIEEQSSAIARSVGAMATSLREAADTANRVEAARRQISSATIASQESIARLDSAGQEIVGIVDTISELSAQTNLLALNATIEAARAGDSGRGFVVVANEVKDLAQRTANSASGIASVVEQIQQRLGQSTDSTATIADLVTALESDQLALTAVMSQQTHVIEEISVAAATSAGGVSGIGEALRRLNQIAAELGSDQMESASSAQPAGVGTA